MTKEEDEVRFLNAVQPAGNAVLAQVAVAVPAVVLMLFSAPDQLVLGYLVSVTLVLLVIVVVRRVRG